MTSILYEVILKLKKKSNRPTYNVVLLGLAFSFIFMAFSTTQALSVSALKTAFPAANSTRSLFVDSIGYYTLLCVYVIFTFSNILAPSILMILGSKMCLIISGCSYVLFVAVYIYPLVYTLYAAACIIGVGAAVLWTSQGKVLLENSNDNTVERNSGIFLALFVFNFVPGNAFVYLYLLDTKVISSLDRFVIFPVLTLLGLIGVVLFFFILPIDGKAERKPRDMSFQNLLKNMLRDFIGGIKDEFSLLLRLETLLLIPLFYTSGLSINIYAGGVYATCFGTIEAPLFSVGLASVSLLLSGLGGISGSVFFAVKGYIRFRLTRKFMLLFSFIVVLLTLLLTYYNMPPYCNYPRPPPDSQVIYGEIIKPSNLYVALVCSFLFGFSDSIIKSVLYSIIGIAYEKIMHGPAVGIYKFFESFALVVSFFYNPIFSLHIQILIFLLVYFAAYVLYVFAEDRISIKMRNRVKQPVEQVELVETANGHLENNVSC